MDIYCYKHAAAGLTLVGVVDDFISFNFTRRYADIGEWQLVLDGESLNAQRVRDADFIRAGQGVAGLVQSIEEGKGEQRTLTLTGVELKALANRRIVEPPAGQAYLHYARTPPETVIAGLLQTQLISPENADRSIAHVSVADYAATGYPVTYDGRFQTVGSEIMTLANTYGIGWYADIEDGTDIVYHIYRGLDRSEGQSVNERLVISESRDSLQASTYGYTTEIPNWILVAGQGEGVDRELVRIGTSSGLTRSELYRDARDVAQGETELLTQRGNETLASFGDGASYTVEFSAAFAQRYRLDYDLGDICTIKDDALPDGHMDIRLTAITEVYEGDALILSVEFGNAKDSLADAINQTTAGTQGLLRAESNVAERVAALENPERQFLDFTFLNGWKNSSSGTNDLIIWKDPWGYVHMAGSIYGGSESKVLELPVGYRTERTYAAFVRNASEGTITDAHLFITGADMRILTDGPLSTVYTISAYYYGV